MNLVKSVFEFAKQIMAEPNHVSINNSKIANIGSMFPEQFHYQIQPQDELQGTIIDLVASSINYCFWYGRPNNRPNNVNCSFLYDIVMNTFFDYGKKSFEECIDALCKLVVLYRFPLSEQRVRHLKQLRNDGEDFAKKTIETKDFSQLFYDLITLFPGFGEDIFLKRASLFFLQLYRRFGWFEEEMNELFVPADYHIPQILNYFDCITYSPELQEMIQFYKQLPKNSQFETEIRAATILAVKEICKVTNWNVSNVDALLFSWRTVIPTEFPFHLTLTTDY